MIRTTLAVMGASACALLFATAFAAAQAPESVRVRGTIDSVDGSIMNVKQRDGTMVKVKLADNGPVRMAVKKSLSDIKPNDFIAITAMPQPDGSQKAVAIAIFPEALRGVGEGHRPWDLSPNSTMTNATVADEVKSVDGATLQVKYKDGELKIIVPTDAEITTFVPATMADVKSGEKIFIAGTKKLPDGTLEAPNITVGDYGVWR